jgi:asparagine synthase (glutamine-hydrolysing)
LERATQSLAHRGPDDSGTVVLRPSSSPSLTIGLGNRRLAILDLSPLGHQPMHDPATGNCIVFNGEIYNFREIRLRLESLGIQFVGNSDTEVLLKAYGAWGARCLDELRGMFAFAVWDAPVQRLFVARDHVGIKPLYYFSSPNNFIFASEVRALLATGLLQRRLNPTALVNYLSFGSMYDPETLIEGVHALLPGHYLEWRNGHMRDVQYWDFPCAQDHQNGNPSALERAGCEQHISTLLRESIEQQLVSDVPLGVFLSGGIDSSSLVAILSRNHSQQLSTFSLAFQESDYNESKYCRAIAERFGTDHHESVISAAEALEAIPEAIHAMDQPTVDGVNTYLVSKKTREAGIKVALSGLGGDEMFGGYSSFRTVPRLERFSHFKHYVPRPVNQAVGAGLGQVLDAISPGDCTEKIAALISENGRLLHPYFVSRLLFLPAQREALLARNSEFSTESAAPLKNAVRAAGMLDPINRVSYLEARCYMQNTLLRDADFMSMAHGLEIRVPLLDHKLAEFLFTLPGSWKLNSGIPKPLLVRATGGLLPDTVVRRAKRGFTLPFEHWLRDEMRPELEKTLGTAPCGPLADILRPDAIRNVWNRFLAGKTSWSRPWALFVLQRWCEAHF